MTFLCKSSFAFTTTKSSPLNLATSSHAPQKAFVPTKQHQTTPLLTTLSIKTRKFDESEFESAEAKSAYFDKINGMGPGMYLFIIVLLINVWEFSIPVEYRRNKFCSAAQVEQQLDPHCMTFQGWASGIADYYKGGGGIHFDFSIEEKAPKK